MSGVLTGFRGEVDLVRSTGGKIIRPAIRQRLYDGDRLVTGKDSYARALVRNGSIIIISENSQFTFRQDDNGGVKSSDIVQLISGKIRVILKKLTGEESDFMVVTPTALCAVRGTDFIVRVNGRNETDVLVIEGIVEIKKINEDLAGSGVSAYSGDAVAITENENILLIRDVKNSEFESFMEGVDVLKLHDAPERADFFIPENSVFREMERNYEKKLNNEEPLFLYGPSKDMLLPGLVEHISIRKNIKSPPPAYPPPPPGK